MPKTVTARGELRRESTGERIGERVGDRVLAVLVSTYEAVQLMKEERSSGSELGLVPIGKSSLEDNLHTSMQMR